MTETLTRKSMDMKRRTSILLSFRAAILAALLLTLSGCEKSDYYDDPETQGQTKDDASDNDSSNDNDEGSGSEDNDDRGSEGSSSDTLSVAEFIQLGEHGGAFVKGYIVGDCTKNSKNADFNPPFSQPQAILLADSQGERNTDNMIAIQLKSGSKVREHMNLKDHPNWWGRLVVFSGYRTSYLGMAGIKSVTSYPTYDP